MTRPPYLYVVTPDSTPNRSPWPPAGIKDHGETIRRLVDYLTDCDRQAPLAVMHAAADIVAAAAAVEVLIAGHARDTAPHSP
jgi:hypothetical protein